VVSTSSTQLPRARIGLGAGVRAAADQVRAIVRGSVQVVRERTAVWLGRGRVANGDPALAGEPAGDVPVDAAAGGRQASGARHLARVLSGVVAAGTAAASALGLWWPGLYQDPPEVAAMLRADDLVASLAAPVLAGALLWARRGSRRAELLWAGLLAYAVYHFALYVFGTTFNALFPAHVALLGLSAAALVLALRSLDIRGLAARVDVRAPVRGVSALLGVLAVALGGMWISSSVRSAVTGAAPVESALVLPTSWIHLGYALDLLLLVPGYAAAAVLLWRRRPWGHALGGILLVSGVVSQLEYMTALVFQTAAGIPGATPYDPAEPVIAAAMLAGATALLAHIRSDPADARAAVR
jgi:hypothetical protein